MSFVVAVPDMLAAAAADVAGIGSSLSEANTAATASTTRVIAAAADEVSAAIASLFSSHGTAFQALSAQAADFHAQFVQALTAGARAYASSEAANAGPLQTLAQALPVPNVAVSAFGLSLQLGTAHSTTSGLGIAIAFGANSDASASGTFNSAFALGAHSTADAVYGNFDTAIAVGTNDAAYAGGIGLPSLYPTYPPGGPQPALSSIGAPGSHDTAFVVGTGSTATAGVGNFDLAAVINGNMQTATATGVNHYVDIVTPSGTAGGAAGLLVPNVAAANPSLLDPNVSVSVSGFNLLHLGSATATSGTGDFAIAVGANSDASAPYLFNAAVALGAGSDATVGSGVSGPGGSFNTAIAVGTNDGAYAGAYEVILGPAPQEFSPGSNNHAFVVGTGSTADTPGVLGEGAGNHDLAAALGNMQHATTSWSAPVDIVTPFGTLAGTPPPL
jgi:PE family